MQHVRAVDDDALMAQKLDEEIRDRLSTELIIALIGPVASGVSTTASLLRRKLQSEFGYDVPEIIKLSDFIKKYEPGQLNDASLADRITSYQDAGNKMRGDRGSGFLAKLAIQQISKIRHADGFRKVTDSLGKEIDVPLPKKRVYIIDSLKHPEEISQLREIYGNILWVIGVSAADHVRQMRLEQLGVPNAKILDILNRDMGQKAEFGQKVRKAFSSADYFVRNDAENGASLEAALLRFLDVLFGAKLHSPTWEESAMFHAATAGSKSACMSRQVGAALVDANGELISVGWNDVPKFGGGLYGETGQDNRCYNWRERICHNDAEKRKIERRVVEGIQLAMVKKAADAPLVEGRKQVLVQLSEEEIVKAIESSGIASLIEFSRAIHAEMAAILAVARDKRHSLDSATMVVTTYPCHNCARHIVAAGVRSVIYIEPYEKSLAIKLHPDAISEDDRMGDRVLFRQFQGFAPRHILDLFAMKADRKGADGKLIEVERKSSLPIYRRHLDSFTLYEDKIVQDVALAAPAN